MRELAVRLILPGGFETLCFGQYYSMPIVNDLKIVSGGQTGADRAALDWAIQHGLPHGGWCPKGRKAEDGPIATRYKLQETRTAKYKQRTVLNVRDSDGTVIFTLAEKLTGGSKATARAAQEAGKPCLHLSPKSICKEAARLLRQFVQDNSIKVLNVAGPRASKEPEVGAFVIAALTEAFLPELNAQPLSRQPLERTQQQRLGKPKIAGRSWRTSASRSCRFGKGTPAMASANWRRSCQARPGCKAAEHPADTLPPLEPKRVASATFTLAVKAPQERENP